ncbi:signal transduction histidine kinase family protein [Mycobacterium xenopi 4042]|uniref:Signal transduction histidine kinase family protein n=1 Tax=Mycobacterium xenopi 4042 TaxID=1299334 RepID=X7YJ09_MYCXE|nr:signal transduction histidine kinase family protein [Mycobacterium xenopi 4042]
MSTLGDLLAEHTVLPGNAVDHLHAVVGEWQLLADLSFADYLMWVRRDDGALVCVAQCRPNTAPTVLLTDTVGTVVSADQLPLVAAAFTSGTIGRNAMRDNIFRGSSGVLTSKRCRCDTASKWWRCSRTKRLWRPTASPAR